jgi:hypothetical protein
VSFGKVTVGRLEELDVEIFRTFALMKVEFTNDLAPGVGPVTMAPCTIVAVKWIEEQLEELLEEKFVRLSVAGEGEGRE